MAYEHDYYELVHIEPNSEMSRQTLIKAFMLHALVWGCGYTEIQRDTGNQAVALWPRNPAKTRPRRLASALRLDPEPWRPFPVNLAAGTMVFQTTDGLDDQDHSEIDAKSRAPRIIPMDDMLAVPGLSFDGRIGQSVVWLARQTLGLALATEKFGAKYFANFARPGGILELPMNLKPEDKDGARRSWMEAQGGENSNRVAVMPPGFKWQPMSNNPQEAQTTETRAYIRNEIAAIFHVPSRMVGDNTKGSKSSTEQENQELLDYTLSPWLSAIKLEFKRKLFPHTGIGRTPKNRFYVDFDITGMLRGDAASREKFNASGKQWGYLNSNDIRALEGLNPIEEAWAEEYWIPVNMTLTTTPIDPTHQDGSGVGVVPDNAHPKKDPAAVAYSGLFRNALDHLLSLKKRDSGAVLKCFGPVLFAIRGLVRDEAIREFGAGGDSRTVESDRFVTEYMGGIRLRCTDWTAAKAEEISGRELTRAIHSIRVVAFREVAAVKATAGHTEKS